MKTYFAEPVVEVVKFAVEDVITESSGTNEPVATSATRPAFAGPCFAS